MEGKQLLTKGQIFEDQILARSEGTKNPTEKVPEPHDHGRNLIETRQNELFDDSLVWWM